MVDLIFIKLNLSKKYWRPQGWSIVMVLQHPPSLIHLFEHTRMVMRLRDIGTTHRLLSYG